MIDDYHSQLPQQRYRYLYGMDEGRRIWKHMITNWGYASKNKRTEVIVYGKTGKLAAICLRRPWPLSKENFWAGPAPSPGGSPSA